MLLKLLTIIIHIEIIIFIRNKTKSLVCISFIISLDVDLNMICKQMGRSPDWMPDILRRGDGYETNFDKKD